jgi:sugar phosphate isomerase/epimerase
MYRTFMGQALDGLEVELMKLSCLPVSFFPDLISGKMTPGKWAAIAANLGLDAVDLSILFFRNLDGDNSVLTRARGEIEAYGVGVAVVNTYPDLTHPDLDERGRQLAQLEEDIGSAAALGAEMVRVTAGQAHPGTSREKGVRWAVDGLTCALDAADRQGVKLVYENHSKPGCWDYADFSHPTDIFLQIADDLASTGMRMLFDTANPIAYGDDPQPILEKIIDRVECVHAADTGKRGELNPVLVGKGLVPFNDIFQLLKRSGFDGTISIEEASGMGREGVEKAVKFIRKTWVDA